MLNRQGSVTITGGPVGSVNPSRRNSTVDSSGRFCSLPTPNGKPEALISLCYLDQAQKIVVTVEKASNLEIDGEKASGEFSINLYIYFEKIYIHTYSFKMIEGN